MKYEKYNFYINRSNGSYPNKLSYDNYLPSQGAYTSSSAISTGRNVVVVTLATTQVKIYENGVNTISGTKTSGDTYSGDSIDKILIGGSRYTNAHSFQSDKLYSVAVWERALSATEAQSLTLDLLANKTGGSGSVSIMTVEQISSARSFTTANPLLANPSTADKGKIVTVNATGDDLQYGPQVLKHNMNFKNIYETGIIQVNQSKANNNPALHPEMFITITPQSTTSKVIVTVNMMGEWSVSPENGMAYLRRTVNGITTDLHPPVKSDSNRGLGQFVISYIGSGAHVNTMEVCNFHYIDV